MAKGKAKGKESKGMICCGCARSRNSDIICKYTIILWSSFRSIAHQFHARSYHTHVFLPLITLFSKSFTAHYNNTCTFSLKFRNFRAIRIRRLVRRYRRKEVCVSFSSCCRFFFLFFFMFLLRLRIVC